MPDSEQRGMMIAASIVMVMAFPWYGIVILARGILGSE
jgi:hypothetical protein